MLTEIHTHAWRLLVRGASDRRSPVHTPVVASVTANGAPDARVMVLRAADREAATLRFHTDARSPKCAALAGKPVSVLAYHPGEAVQLRIAGSARIHTHGEAVERIWAQSTAFARRVYLTTGAPGTLVATASSGLPEAIEGQKPDEADLVPARANFALVVVQIAEIDWLHLAQSGHRRARFCADDGWAGQWLLP